MEVVLIYPDCKQCSSKKVERGGVGIEKGYFSTPIPLLAGDNTRRAFTVPGTTIGSEGEIPCIRPSNLSTGCNYLLIQFS